MGLVTVTHPEKLINYITFIPSNLPKHTFVRFLWRTSAQIHVQIHMHNFGFCFAYLKAVPDFGKDKTSASSFAGEHMPFGCRNNAHLAAIYYSWDLGLDERIINGTLSGRELVVSAGMV